MSPEQLAMAHCRYQLAASYATGRDVLEIGCGTAFGLEFLWNRARSIVGGDIAEGNLADARRHAPHLPLVGLDGHRLPFPDRSFDVVVMFEVIYYLTDPTCAFAECHRVLRSGGTVLISLPNRDWPGFHESPFSMRYFSAPELAEALKGNGFDAVLYGGFPVGRGLREQIFIQAARAGRVLHVIPRSLAGRARLKRLLYVRLPVLDRIREDANEYPPLLEIPRDRITREFKNLYAVARPRAYK